MTQLMVFIEIPEMMSSEPDLLGVHLQVVPVESLPVLHETLRTLLADPEGSEKMSCDETSTK